MTAHRTHHRLGLFLAIAATGVATADDTIDPADTQAIRASLGHCVGEPGYDAEADLKIQQAALAKPTKGTSPAWRHSGDRGWGHHDNEQRVEAGDCSTPAVGTCGKGEPEHARKLWQQSLEGACNDPADDDVIPVGEPELEPFVQVAAEQFEAEHTSLKRPREDASRNMGPADQTPAPKSGESAPSAMSPVAVGAASFC